MLLRRQVVTVTVIASQRRDQIFRLIRKALSRMKRLKAIIKQVQTGMKEMNALQQESLLKVIVTLINN
jgi:molybdopterin synthase catalytic subunit